MKTLIVIVLALACTACSSMPKLDKVDDFSVAANNSTELLKNAAAANKSLAIRTGEEIEAAKYVDKKPFTLTVTPAPNLSKEIFTVRLEPLIALQAYAQALKLAVDEGITTKLEEASMRLGTASGSIAASSPLAGPAFQLAARGLGYALSNAHARRVLAIIKATDPSVEKVTEKLQEDFAVVAEDLGEQLMLFTAERRKALTLIRGNSSADSLRISDRLELYKEYKLARQDVATQQALITIVRNYSEILQNLREAHAELASGKPDNDVALKNFVTMTNDFVDLFTAITKERAS